MEDLRPLHELVSGKETLRKSGKETLRKSGRDKIEASHPLGLIASVGVDRQGDMASGICVKWMMKMDGSGQQNGPGFGFVWAGLNFIEPVC